MEKSEKSMKSYEELLPERQPWQSEKRWQAIVKTTKKLASQQVLSPQEFEEMRQRHFATRGNDIRAERSAGVSSAVGGKAEKLSSLEKESGSNT